LNVRVQYHKNVTYPGTYFIKHFYFFVVYVKGCQYDVAYCQKIPSIAIFHQNYY